MGRFLFVVLSVFAYAAYSEEPKKVDAPNKKSSQKDTDGKNVKGASNEQSALQPQTVNVVAPSKVEFVSKNAEEKGNNKDEGGHSYIKLAIDFLILVATGVIAVFTARLFFATRGLLIEAKNQFPHFKTNVEAATTTANAVVAQMRAYVSVVSAKIYGFDQEGSSKIQLNIENTGQTVAYEVIWEGGVTIRDAAITRFKGDLRPEDAKAIPHSKGAMAPRINSMAILEIPAASLSVQEKMAIKGHSRGIFVYGTIFYKDALKNPRHTNYRLVYGGEPGASPNGNFSICDEGNDAE